MKKTALLLIVTSLVIASSALGDTIRLTCKYSHSIDAQEEITEVSGEELITIKYSDNSQAIIKIQDKGTEYIGSVSAEEIVGEANYKIQGNIYYETLIIHRQTGAFRRTFGIVGGIDGIVYFGNCMPPATEKNF
ncbi:MAG: hypothetical protein AMJ61_01460 [Desulfobacterales bacterium SG8_35_2]|nr:MAG: hypothetical protein AMJ61_01460 [Desulfobacterales bacterium SG8_35_2]